jgi:peptidoglycan hydrolase CwlO-like protein
MEYTIEELQHELQHINNQLDPTQADWTMSIAEYIKLVGQAGWLEEQIEKREYDQSEYLRHMPLEALEYIQMLKGEL